MKKIDIKIIKSLERNSRKPFSQLEKEIGISRAAISKRVAKMLKNGLISFNTCLNIRSLGFRIGWIGFSVEGTNNILQMMETLRSCPRVLSFARPVGDINLLVCLYGEDERTLRSTIESFRTFPKVEVAFIYHSDPPVYPETLYVRMPRERGEKTPCGQDCMECSSFKTDQCLGCPAIKCYRGPI